MSATAARTTPQPGTCGARRRRWPGPRPPHPRTHRTACWRCRMIPPAPTATVQDAVPADDAEWIDQAQLTRAQKALLALSAEVARQLAEDHDVCVRPLA